MKPKIMSAEELLARPSLPREQVKEHEYRRGYRDGWIQAIYAMSDSMFQRHLSRQAAFDACYEHWERALRDWEKSDLTQKTWPPDLE